MAEKLQKFLRVSDILKHLIIVSPLKSLRVLKF